MNIFASLPELRFAIAFVEIGSVVKALLKGLNRSRERFQSESITHMVSLPYDGMPGTYRFNVPYRLLLWRPLNHDCPVTCITSDVSDAADHAIRAFAKSVKEVVVQVHLFDNKPLYPGCKFAHYVNYRNEARSLAAMKTEAGWEFFASGKALPFELISLYEDAEVARRLTRQIAGIYLDALGLDVNAESFWKSEHLTIITRGSTI